MKFLNPEQKLTYNNGYVTVPLYHAANPFVVNGRQRNFLRLHIYCGFSHFFTKTVDRTIFNGINVGFSPTDSPSTLVFKEVYVVQNF